MRILKTRTQNRRRESTFGLDRHIHSTRLSSKGNQIPVPKGFAHGFSRSCRTPRYSTRSRDLFSKHDRSILFSDPAMAIGWRPMADGFQLCPERGAITR
ncbi:dTDP-4-dehydrorhamnose 3,5-epimerase family protein [Mesorhizobium sp. M0130]|uniref:dTDP-4-dehydrorhamnose 3,5-epimerase family protein n=1 Tax=Mesorhizobium sp. M0130 TaxID=2956887 RepID=UPI0033381CA5